MKLFISIFSLSFFVLGQAKAGSQFSALRKSILSDYDKAVSPDEQTKVNISITLLDLGYCNYKQMLSFKSWFFESWIDQRLSWSPDQYGGLERIRLPASEVWLPDIAVYNGMEEFKGMMFDWQEAPRVVVLSSGLVLFVPSSTGKTFCPDNGPADESWKWAERSCNITVGSWTYDQSVVDVNIMDSQWRKPVDLKHFLNKRIEIVSTDAVKEDIEYGCCPGEIYPQLKFNVNFKTLARMQDDKVETAP